jgi:hypothetical protein
VSVVLDHEQVQLVDRHETSQSARLSFAGILFTGYRYGKRLIIILRVWIGSPGGHPLDPVGRAIAVRQADDFALGRARVVLVERLRVCLVPHLVLVLVWWGVRDGMCFGAVYDDAMNLLRCGVWLLYPAGNRVSKLPWLQYRQGLLYI